MTYTRFTANSKGDIQMITNENRNVATGLCMTCNHAKCCVYLANATSSIWCCEEFDDRLPAIEENRDMLEEQPIELGELKARVA
jgi:hypothetical protein